MIVHGYLDGDKYHGYLDGDKYHGYLDGDKYFFKSASDTPTVFLRIER